MCGYTQKIRARTHNDCNIDFFRLYIRITAQLVSKFRSIHPLNSVRYHHGYPVEALQDQDVHEQQRWVVSDHEGEHMGQAQERRRQ